MRIYPPQSYTNEKSLSKVSLTHPHLSVLMTITDFLLYKNKKQKTHKIKPKNKQKPKKFT